MYDIDDDDHSEYTEDEYQSRLYQEHAAEAISEFTAERLSSYFLANPTSGAPAASLLDEAEALQAIHPRAALAFAVAAAEVCYKSGLLNPVVHGLVHYEPAAPLIAELAVKQTGLDRFHALLVAILAEHGGVDLSQYRRTPGGKTLLSELKDVQGWRNAVLHRGEDASAEQAATAVAVATTFLDEIQPALLSALGLHAHERGVVCVDQAWQCGGEREAVGQRD